MKIDIRQHKGTYRMREDGQFVCIHSNVRVEPPCCSGGTGNIECGCQGMYEVFCFDCLNKEMADWEVDEFVDKYINEEINERIAK